MGLFYLSAGVQDWWLGPRWRNPSGGPDGEALPCWQLNGLWQDQWLLPGAIPRQWHGQLLGNKSQEEEQMPGRKPTAPHTVLPTPPLHSCTHLQPTEPHPTGHRGAPKHHWSQLQATQGHVCPSWAACGWEGEDGVQQSGNRMQHCPKINGQTNSKDPSHTGNVGSWCPERDTKVQSAVCYSDDRIGNKPWRDREGHCEARCA